jgi:phage/plasmid-like protein (TIGR03299 family)
MAHELLEHDNVVLYKNAAWHGLGTIVQDAPTPAEALKLARLDWDVLQAPLWASCPDGGSIEVDSHVLNFRSDTEDQLGIVTDGYRPIQNSELAEFCFALAEQGDEVKCETAGSIRNGKKVWFLLKGESFSVRGKDEVQPFILVSNGHDGGTALRCTPTTIRVVCSNTLHMVIPQTEGSSRAPVQAKFVAHHTQTILDRVEEAKAALQLYGRTLEQNRELIDHLAAKDVNREQVQAFFLECYTRDFGAFPANPQNKVEQNSRDRAMDACNSVFGRFDQEHDLCGATAWNAMNSYTWWLQWDRRLRGKDLARVAERRIESKLFGVDSERTLNALATALSL